MLKDSVALQEAVNLAADITSKNNTFIIDVLKRVSQKIVFRVLLVF